MSWPPTCQLSSIRAPIIGTDAAHHWRPTARALPAPFEFLHTIIDTLIEGATVQRQLRSPVACVPLLVSQVNHDAARSRGVCSHPTFWASCIHIP
jgi:hypothetical protein